MEILLTTTQIRIFKMASTAPIGFQKEMGLVP
jgi:hypothetical protein